MGKLCRTSRTIPKARRNRIERIQRTIQLVAHSKHCFDQPKAKARIRSCPSPRRNRRIEEGTRSIFSLGTNEEEHGRQRQGSSTPIGRSRTSCLERRPKTSPKDGSPSSRTRKRTRFRTTTNC